MDEGRGHEVRDVHAVLLDECVPDLNVLRRRHNDRTLTILPVVTKHGIYCSEMGRRAVVLLGGCAAGGCRLINSFANVSRYHISDVPDAAIVEVEVAEVRLARLDQDAQDLQNGLVAIALGEHLHGACYEVELLLEIIETDRGIDSVPVQDLVFHYGRFD